MTREEAINTVRNIYQTDKEKEALATLIPELRESEDERIRKQLIDAIKIGRSNSGISFTEEAASRYIAWLEKHSEEEIQKIRKEEYTNGFNDAAGLGKQKEQKQEWSESDKQNINLIISYLDSYIEEHNDTFGADECKYLKYWFKSLKPQPKQEWSEEDEKIVKSIINYLSYDGTQAILTVEVDKWIAWLKSLKPSWKPSEEQMKALLNAEGFLRAGLQHDSAKTIAELYEQLKKLM